MRHLKLILAASLSLAALISAQATIIPWTLSNFEYASEYGQDYVTKVERDNLSFSFSLSDTSGMTSTLPPPVTGQFNLSSITFGLSKKVSTTNWPLLIITQNGKFIAKSIKTTTIVQPLSTSSQPIDPTNPAVYYPTWLFGFDEDVYLDASVTYDVTFARAFDDVTQEITPYSFPAGEEQGVLLNSKIDETLWRPFIQFRGTYDPSLMPEPTALTVVAVGAAFALLRRRAG